MNKARIEFIEGRNGSYGCADSRWDTLPEWEFWVAYIVKVWVEGRLAWGPFKYRSTAKQSHSGISTAKVFFCRLFNREPEKAMAEEFALEMATALEAKGFEVELVCLTDKSSQNMDSKIDWVQDPPPPIFQKKIRPAMANMSP
jgi:hypothetical protein